MTPEAALAHTVLERARSNRRVTAACDATNAAITRFGKAAKRDDATLEELEAHKAEVLQLFEVQLDLVIKAHQIDTHVWEAEDGA